VEKSAKFISSIDEHREKKRWILKNKIGIMFEGFWVTIATDTILRWKIRSKTEYALLKLLERIEKDYKEKSYPLSQKD
jgi:hypothetical protein